MEVVKVRILKFVLFSPGYSKGALKGDSSDQEPYKNEIKYYKLNHPAK